MRFTKVNNRIPHEFFITKGKGESELSAKVGSFHIALNQAGIAAANIMKYSSVLPATARLTEYSAPVHGEVMEVIMAQADGKTGERLTAGITFAWLYGKNTSERAGGLVCEYEGGMDKQDASRRLSEGLLEIFEHGFSEQFNLGEPETYIESFTPDKTFGTALVALCFKNYLIPEGDDTLNDLII
ncbi:MAG: pyruvoyl-dependent arginine decarboxylase [Bacteroidota bacterium]|nr:pyruvoyl-dependent arginine decarboxylase [Bacteroidota bacterium]